MYDIEGFREHQAAHLPSDHAPVTLEMQLPKANLSVLDKRANILGGHGSLMGRERGGGQARRPVGFFFC